MGNRKVKGREYNTLKKVLVLWMAIIAYMVTSHRVTVKLEEGIKKTKTENAVNNIFDEMQINYCEGLRRAKNIRTLLMYDPPRRNVVPFTYKCLEDNPAIFARIWQDTGWYIRKVPIQTVYNFYILDTEKGYSDGLLFAYRSDIKTIYIFEYQDRTAGGTEEGEGEMGDYTALPLDELAYYRDYFLYEVIIGEWIKSGESRYTMEDLGDFTIADYTVPYEYCGAGCGSVEPEEVISTEHNHGGSLSRTESYAIWLDNERLRCIQQKISYPHEGELAREDLDGYQYRKDKAQISLADYYGTDRDSSRFIVQDKDTGGICRLDDLINMDEAFMEWLKGSGQIKGNLERTPESRETGEKDTLEMLENCPEEKVREALEQAEFYIEPGYLHIRFPYWNDRAQEPGWVMNGNTVWKGWLTVRAEDIREFLTVEPW